MDLDELNGFSLHNLADINVILGKNGCGKSFALKTIEQALGGKEGFGEVRYISPERAGFLSYEPSVDQNISSNVNWLLGQRRKNQSSNFKQQSTALFRQLELLVLLKIEADHTKAEYEPTSFNHTVSKINGLLDRIELVRDVGKAFVLREKQTKNPATAEDISSGESEIISLAIEFLSFVNGAENEKINILFADEPDVHLHPDLQDKLSRFIVDTARDKPVTIIVATHSTALLAGLSEYAATRVAFMGRGEQNLVFKDVTDIDRAILPIFGAHPLSNVFNEAPILLVEGEDDERVWQQARRSSNGDIRVFPCVAESVDRLSEYETEVNNIIKAVYDDARAYSLRDRDLNPEMIDDLEHVIRMRLGCRAAENLMLSDDTLTSAGITWDELKAAIEAWVQANPHHPYSKHVVDFVAAGFDRKGHNLKNIRNILIGLFSNKPWEVLVGQAVAALVANPTPVSEGSLRDFLGEKTCGELLKLA